MTKLFLSLFFLSQFLEPLNAQTRLDIELVQGESVIKPSFSNISKLLDIGYSDFVSAMKQNSYILTTDGTMYHCHTILFTYTIQKKTDAMLWTFSDNNNNFISRLKSEIKAKYPSIIPTYESGVEIYRMKLKDGRRLKIGVQDDSDGAAVYVYPM